MSDTTQVHVREAVAEDVPSLVGWNATMAETTESKVLDQDTLKAGVQGVLADAHRGFYLVAELDGKPVGGLLVTYEWSDWRNGNFWWVQSVYVEADARRRGVFRALYAAVTERARETGAVGLRLYVELDNAGAQATYEAMGMRRCQYHLYESIFK